MHALLPDQQGLKQVALLMHAAQHWISLLQPFLGRWKHDKAVEKTNQTKRQPVNHKPQQPIMLLGQTGGEAPAPIIATTYQ